MTKTSNSYEWALYIAFLILAGVMALSAGTCNGEVVVVSSKACAPCARMTPHVHELQRAGQDIHQTYTEWDSEITKSYGVRALPTTIVFKDGREVTRHVGYLGYRQLEQLCQLGQSPRSGHWVIQPLPVAWVGVFNVGVGVTRYEWRWIPGDQEGVH